MMYKVVMLGWREGLQKVSLSKLQMELLNKGLKEAKNNVDSLLEGNEVVIKIENENLAKEFSDKANSLGVNCVIRK